MEVIASYTRPSPFARHRPSRRLDAQCNITFRSNRRPWRISRGTSSRSAMLSAWRFPWKMSSIPRALLGVRRSMLGEHVRTSVCSNSSHTRALASLGRPSRLHRNPHLRPRKPWRGALDARPKTDAVSPSSSRTRNASHGECKIPKKAQDAARPALSAASMGDESASKGLCSISSSLASMHLAEFPSRTAKPRRRALFLPHDTRAQADPLRQNVCAYCS